MQDNPHVELPPILLIEDDKDQAYVLKHFLQSSGYSVTWCSSPRTALKTAHQTSFQLILLDVMLDDEKDGFHLCRQFKSDPDLHSIPIIMVTARTAAKDRVDGLRLGIDDYVTKPFSRDELLARIDVVLRRKKFLDVNVRYRELLENADEMVIFLNTKGKIEHANRKAEFLLPDLENAEEEIAFYELFEELLINSIDSMIPRVLTGNEVTGNSWRLKKARQNIQSVDVKLMPLRQGDRITGIGCILRDSSARERVFQALEENTQALRKEVENTSARLSEMQEKLIVSEKMAVMGQLAAGIAHELRNPLNIIGTSVYYLQRVLKQRNRKVYEHLDIITQEIARAQKIITSLLNFSRKSVEDRSEVDINGIIDQTLALVGKELAINDIILNREFSEVKKCHVNPDDMKQVFLNLILNAKDSMSKGGTLTVRTTMHDEDHILVEFSDTGTGIPEEIKNKIFDPFFTAKKDGQGIGIGLSIVHSAIQRNQGTISLRSVLGEGTTFLITLPAFLTSVNRFAVI
jgi:signal transduction histidine kinase